MTKYNTLNVKLSNWQLSNSKSGTKIQVTLIFSLNVVGESNDQTIFPLRLLLTNTHVFRICKVFANISSTNIKFRKIQLSKMVQLEGFLGSLLGP